MVKVKVGIAGCMGKMGQELIKQILEDKNFLFVGGLEHKSHPKIGRKIIMLHSFIKKSQKTPKKEIKIAKSRMKEILKNETF